MPCASCGRESIDGAAYCAYCGAKVSAGPQSAPPVVLPAPHVLGVPFAPATPTPGPRTSRLAVASLILSLLGLVTVGLSALVGLVLGVVSLVRIGGSQGRLRGTGLAVAGTAVSALMLLVVPAAILFPVFIKAREKARQAACASNLMQISRALRTYCSDNDGWFPPAAAWTDSLYPQLGSQAVFRCPSENAALQSYGLNEALDRGDLRAVHSPTEAVMAFDSAPGQNASGGLGLVIARHESRANVAFVDGHVKWVDSGDLPALLWYPIATPGAPK